MILLYTMFVAMLVVLHWLVRRRVVALEKHYAKAASEADSVLKIPLCKQGTSQRPDAVAEAKRQYRLGRLAERRDAVEARYAAWQGTGEKLERLIAGVRGWKGRKVPYTFGVLDVIGTLAIIDQFGVGQYVSFPALFQLALSCFGRG